jgi:orotidine-5'-phosphate decarboxylase
MSIGGGESVRPSALGPERPRQARERIIVALDFQTAPDALALVDQLAGEVLWYKVGMELFYAEGSGLLTELQARGKRIFLDLKLHDIPNTMASALRSLARYPVSLTTLHVPAGREALHACVEEARRIGQDRAAPLGLLGVTRLTSLPAPDPARPWADVVVLAGQALEAGLYGWIAPPVAAPSLRQAWGAGPVLVCPGIRLPEQGKQDQVAVGTPEEAVRGGADFLVVGRPVTRAPDPVRAVREIIQRLG